mmetsp:Transcript_61116/g.138060  ORF Transcript_61116/g.138060 Transcript_61116/m.138060 type:complete len:782 (+) Transcript_61116:23-2368(+)
MSRVARAKRCPAADATVQQHYVQCTDLVSTCGLLADCSVQIEHQPLKHAMLQGVVSVVGALETKCRDWITFMVRSLLSASDSREWAEDKVQYDILWTLRLLSEQSNLAKQWIVEAGGGQAAAQAVACHPQHDELAEEGTALVYELLGVSGLMKMLHITDSHVQTATVWQIYNRCKERGVAPGSLPSKALSKNAVHWPEAPALVVQLLQVMQANLRSTVNLDLLWSCCSTLRRLVAAEPSRGRLFCAQGGVESLLGTIKAAHNALLQANSRDTGEGLLTAATRLATVIADASEEVVSALRGGGVLQALVGEDVQGLRTTAAEDIMWTVGQVHGVNAVLQAMSHVSYSRPSVHGGLVVLSEIVWNPSIEFANAGVHAEYVQVAPFLLNLAQMKMPAEDTALALKSLGGVLHILAPQVPPGAWQVADDSVKLLADAVRSGDDKAIVQEAAECLGRVACISPQWRHLLRQTISILSARLHTKHTACEGLLKKYLFWATAAIAGLPAVLQEMRSQQMDPQVQDAAICAIIDIVNDDDGEGDPNESFSLRKERDATDGKCFIETQEVVVAAMRCHGAFVTVQARGSFALGMLQAVLPEAEAARREVLDVVLEALWTHPSDHRVMQGVSFALRAMLEPHRQSGGRTPTGVSSSNIKRTVAVLMEQAARAGLWSIVETYDRPTRSLSEEELAEMLEDALFVLGILSGVPAVCDAIAANAHMQVSGLKALFELLRTFPEELTPAVSVGLRRMLEEVYTSSINQKSGPGRDKSADVQRHVEMLKGLLTMQC